MLISSKPNPAFKDTAALKERFQQASRKAEAERKVVDRLERMGEAYLSLDGSEFDQDDAPGRVFVGNDQKIAEVQARPFGGVLSMEVVDSSGAEPKEFKITPDYTGVAYSMKEGEVETFVYDNGNGLLALLEQIKAVAPDKGEKPEKDQPQES